MSDDCVVRLSFPARAEYLILARLALAGVARAVPIPDETLADLKLAVTEACGNVVRHAYNGDGEGICRVTIETREGMISIAVEDDGVGLPENAGVNGVDDSFGESGMGLGIIGAIADELDLRRAGPDGGTQLTLRKRLQT